MTATPRCRPTETLNEACARQEAYCVAWVLVRRIGAYDPRFSLRMSLGTCP